jgi:hypothetical protein
MTTEHGKGMDVLREVTRTALGKGKHHARGLEHLALTMAGAVATYHDPETVRAGTREGHHVDSCWFEIKGVQYLLSYSEGAGCIRTGGRHGSVDLQLTETTTGQDVLDWFEGKNPLPVIL